MKKIIVMFFLMISALSIVSATVNLDFRLDVEEKGFYPNEKVPLDISVVNRDSTFTAKDAELIVYISDRFYTFDLGSLEPGETFEEKITLPEFPAGTHNIKGEINYTGIFDERFIETSYGSFEVLFPPIERYPRNVYVSNYDLPEKIIEGKSYNVSITITNDGEVNANLLIEFGSLEEFFTKETMLNSGESTTIKMTVEFENSGVSLIEARVYTLINGEKYLLNYRGKKTYVQGERKAKLIFDRIELVGEPDNKINQNDNVKFKIFLKNDGETATSVIGELLSTVGEINILDKIVSYLTIIKKDIVAPSEDIFEIETKGIEVGDYELDLKLNYTDSENREKEIKIPITINEGGDTCYKDTDCSETQTCEDSQCVKVPCKCGEAKKHECYPYECCFDTNCEEDFVCNLEKHKCEIPVTFQKDVLIITVGNKLDKTDTYYSTLKEYMEVLQQEDLTSFYIELDSQKLEKFFNIKLKNSQDWREIRDIIHKIVDKTKAEYILILGGVGVIPQPLAKTEAEIPTIPLSDDRYSDLDFDGLPDIAIGRIPIPAGESSTDIIIKTINSAIIMHKKELIYGVEFAEECLFQSHCNTYDVDIVAEAMFNKKCSESSQCYFEPPYCSRSNCDGQDKFYQELLNRDIIHIASHANPWGFGLFHSSNILYKKPFFTNPLFFTIGCHSGTIDCEEYGCIKEDGNVFAFLANGASAYIGNTRYGYGGGLTAGYLNTFYFNLKEGDTIGKAMLNMKREALENSQSDFRNAVIYEIQLYGDPTLKIKI